MANLRSLRELVPVTSFAREVVQRPPELELAAGLRWGKPGSFAFSANVPELPLGSQSPPDWVEIEESGELPPRTVRYSLRGTHRHYIRSYKEDISSPSPACGGAWSSGALYFKEVDTIAFQFTENLPKRYLGQLGNPKRYWNYTLSFIRRPDAHIVLSL